MSDRTPAGFGHQNESNISVLHLTLTSGFWLTVELHRMNLFNLFIQYAKTCSDLTAWLHMTTDFIWIGNP